jgi:hypothetical protein
VWTLSFYFSKLNIIRSSKRVGDYTGLNHLSKGNIIEIGKVVDITKNKRHLEFSYCFLNTQLKLFEIIFETFFPGFRNDGIFYGTDSGWRPRWGRVITGPRREKIS